MDITLVRRAFQKLWNFSVLTNYNIDLSTAYYSLQQESLNSDDMLLYVTHPVKPELEGSLIEADGQQWIVYISMKEIVNRNLYEYRLYPVIDNIVLRERVTVANALGVNITEDTGVEHNIACYIIEYSLKERTVPTAQPLEAYQQVFIIACKSLPDYRGIYTLKYQNINYKIDSFEKIAGIIKIRATENL